MTIQELAGIFRISVHTVAKYRRLGIIPKANHRGRGALYDRRHVEAIRAWRDLQHLNVRAGDVVTFCKEEGITIMEYNERRRQSIADFGIGVA